MQKLEPKLFPHSLTQSQIPIISSESMALVLLVGAFVLLLFSVTASDLLSPSDLQIKQRRKRKSITSSTKMTLKNRGPTAAAAAAAAKEKEVDDRRTVETSASSSSLSSSSSVNKTTKKTKTYPKVSELPPYGQSVFWVTWQNDTSPTSTKLFYCAATGLGIIGLLNISVFLQWLLPNYMDHGWDERHGISSSSSPLVVAMTTTSMLSPLIQQSLGLSEEVVTLIFQITFGVYMALIVADILLAALAASISDKKTTTTYPWPESWKVENTICYHDMFTEPTRMSRLIRRPGNTLSNFTYLMTSLFVVASAVTTTSGGSLFWVADIEFGIILFVLAIFSTLWHGSNAPWTQYVDLWSMDSSIVYLILRNFCLGGLSFLVNTVGVKLEYAQIIVGHGICTGLFTLVVIGGGKHAYENYEKRSLHGSCPFSVRARLSGTSNMFGNGQKDFTISTMWYFLSLPVFYVMGPLLIQLLFLKHSGSIQAGEICYTTLVIGWTYRGIMERFAFDGNPIMNWFLSIGGGDDDEEEVEKEKDKTSSFFLSSVRTVGCAIFSPTAILHVMTGITLLAGYLHSRSLEEQFNG